jgi:ABC-2 type transport system permease protein
MNNLVLAELHKARATRAIWAMAGIALASCVAWAAIQVLVFMTDDRPGAVERSVESAYSMAQQGYVFVMIVGIILTASEYRHRTVTWTFLVTPKRGKVITAKLITAAIIGLAVGLAAILLTAPVAAALLAANDYPVWTSDIPLVLIGSVLSTVLWCVFGTALGALIRNLVAAVTFAFIWFFYAEWALVMLVPAVGKWTPTGVGKAVSGWTRDGLSTGDAPFAAGQLLPMWAGGLLLLAYALIAATAARLTTTRRDVT